MNNGNVRLSLSGLRNKTDQQLALLVRKEIERALKFVRQGGMAEAEAGGVRARTLLAITCLAKGERAELETRLEELRLAIERGRGAPMAYTQSACY